MGTNKIAVQICQSIEEAPNYKRDDLPFKPLSIEKAVIVRNGTQNGNDTIDLQLVDEEGNQYVTMVTGRILKGVTDLTITDRH